jgi:predicted ATPase with chaperone activity
MTRCIVLVGGVMPRFSQLITENWLTPNILATAFWVSRSSNRRFLTWSPTVRASKSVSFGFKVLSLMGSSCKRATQPCPCGYLGHYGGRCRCTPDQVLRYRGRISGPLLDRIDIQIEVPAVPPEDLSQARSGDSSATIRSRVVQARARMITRQGKENARLTTREIDKCCALDEKGATLLKQAISRLGLSARGYHRILKVARTIADLADSEKIATAHIAEAIQYRRFDR